MDVGLEQWNQGGDKRFGKKYGIGLLQLDFVRWNTRVFVGFLSMIFGSRELLELNLDGYGIILSNFDAQKPIKHQNTWLQGPPLAGGGMTSFANFIQQEPSQSLWADEFNLAATRPPSSRIWTSRDIRSLCRPGSVPDSWCDKAGSWIKRFLCSVRFHPWNDGTLCTWWPTMEPWMAGQVIIGEQASQVGHQFAVYCIEIFSQLWS